MQLWPVALVSIVAAVLLICEPFALGPFAQRVLGLDHLDDFRLELALKAAFSLDPYLWVLPVVLSVEQGRVTVSGQVDLPIQKRFVMRKISEIVDSSAIVDRVSVRLDPASEARARAGHR